MAEVPSGPSADGPPDGPPPLAERVAALLCEPAGANGAPPERLVVAGSLPRDVRAALPPALAVVGAEAALDGAVTGVLMLDGLSTVDDVAEPGRVDRLLGTACRRFPGRLVVWQRDADADRALPATRFFAHGFRRRLVEPRADGGRDALYDFRLADYKQPPDWLNARFWANPERFGL